LVFKNFFDHFWGKINGCTLVRGCRL